MPLLTKEILPVRSYKVRKGSQREPKDFDVKYLTKIAATTNKMIANGLKIPAPFDHSKNAIPRTEVEINKDKAASSYNNAGYWNSFWVAPNEKGKPALYGQVDAPGSLDDKDSPYYKLKNTCKEVSISLADEYEDGLGRTWTDGLLHVAVVNHAIVPDQSPFEDSNISIVNLSMADPDTDDEESKSSSDEPGSKSEGALAELVTALRKLNVVLPSDTSTKTFMRDLLVAVSNVPNRPNQEIEPIPVYMSIGEPNDMALSQAQAEALVATKAVNPATNQPFTMEDLGFKKAPVVAPTDMSSLTSQVAELQKENVGLRQLATLFKKSLENTVINGLKERLAKLQAAGLPKEFIDTTLAPQLATYNMSALTADGNLPSHPLELTLSAIEATLPAKSKQNGGWPDDAHILLNKDSDNSMNDAEMDEAVNKMLADL